MLLRLLNSIASLFGYRWVIDNSTIDGEEDILADEGYQQIEESTARYKLIRTTADKD